MVQATSGKDWRCNNRWLKEMDASGGHFPYLILKFTVLFVNANPAG